jgi:hypothetical protein
VLTAALSASRHLERLNVAGNRLTHVSAVALASVVLDGKGTALCQLDLSRNKLCGSDGREGSGLLALAATRLGADVAALDVRDGRVFVAADPARGVTYGALLGGRRFDLAISGDAPLKPVGRYRLVGRALPRADLRARVDGSKRFLQQMKLPGMLHARVVRPPGQAAYGAGAPVLNMALNPDILASVSRHAARPRLVVGFAAETEQVVGHAQAKLARKGCDWIVANDVRPETGIMGGTDNAVTLISANGPEPWPRMTKDAVARKLAARIAEALQ